MSNKGKAHILNHEELEAEIQKQKDDACSALEAKQSKHSLDSDEEDESEKIFKYNVLDPNELEGQEEGTIEFDGEIKITPFNMKEELESGYFDKEGTYIFQKDDEDEVKDQWLDDIDWVKIKANVPKRKDMDEDSDEETPQINLVEKYKQMLGLMLPKETVQKAICRLGGAKSSKGAANRWKRKKDDANDKAPDETGKDVEKLQQLTSFANDIISSGDMDIYQQTYEKMTFFVNSRSVASGSELDMFGDDFEEKVDEDKTSEQVSQVSSTSNDGAAESDSEVQWEFKWETSDDAKVYGPFPTSQMIQWVEEKYFEDGVQVRQVGKANAEFYSSKRIDFELYT